MGTLSLSIFAPLFLALPAPFQAVTMMMLGFLSVGLFTGVRVEHAHDAQVQKVEVMQARADLEAAVVAAEVAHGDGWTTKPIHPAPGKRVKKTAPVNSSPATPAKP